MIRDQVAALVARQPLVLVVGPHGAGRAAALTILVGPAAGGTMIDLGALWMAVDPPGDRPRTVRLNGAPSAVAGKGWEAIAGAIGAVAAPPAVVLVDTFQGLAAALGSAGAAETVSALVAPGRTVVLVLDVLAEAEQFGPLAQRFGVVVSVDAQGIRSVSAVADGSASVGPGSGGEVPRRAWGEAAAELAKPAPVTPPVVPEPRAGDERIGERRRWWRRRTEPDSTGALSAPEPRAAGPAVNVAVRVVDTSGAPVGRPLTPGGYYLIQLAMRAATSDDLGAWVQVSVVSDAVPVPSGPHAMFVPASGAAWTCPCQPGGPHTCLPEERSERLELPFVAPRRPDVYRVHLAVRHRATVIHQTRLELPVAGPGLVLPESAGPSATVTYEASRPSTGQ
ncbi:hypothetical protein [Cryptosporangium phraense]|uniref:Uncharacterized protein n=1 Tax=Cryptosporangium phraense TaxID=2593070 RepID=A0A545AEL3_9ACTN|nr:hypothetical protein [Cryptosporangium phraense]TQS39753.1 hypothetical protein FL583_38465 [Cryptosporangium phraense]